MKIVNIIGGLGNQLFQYAFATALQQKFPQEEIKLNLSCFNGYPLHQGFELDKLFSITMNKASLKDLIKVAYPWGNYRLWQIGTRFLPVRKSMINEMDFNYNPDWNLIAQKSYFDGYWQSPIFFQDIRNNLMEQLKMSNLEDRQNQTVSKWIVENKVAFIHVRRGDYINHPLFSGICTDKYYTKGIEKLRLFGFSKFIIFSNDIKWCKKNLNDHLQNEEWIFADWNHDFDNYKDIYLMMLCNGALIANSSFSWWGAWLNKNKDRIIISPKKWNNNIYSKDMILNDWIKIDS